MQLPVIESLTQKQSIITKVVISSAAASVLITAVPDDSTTPIANQIADMSSYLLFAQIVLLIEKYLYGVAGFCSWGILFPAAAVLFAFYLIFKRKALKTLASRIALFATCIYFLVPISVRVDGYIENTYHVSQTINKVVPEESENVDVTTEVEKTSFLEKAKGFFSDIGTSVSNLSASAQELLQNFIDAVVVLILTTCVIPVAVFFVIVYVLKSLILVIRNL